MVLVHVHVEAAREGDSVPGVRVSRPRGRAKVRAMITVEKPQGLAKCAKPAEVLFTNGMGVLQLYNS